MATTSGVVLLAGGVLLGAGALTAAGQTGLVVDGSAAQLGKSVVVFDPSMTTAQIQTVVDGIAKQQVSNQFGTQRYALLFKPGTYGTADAPLNFQVGYYTEVAGLGASPDDVVINGTINVYNQCDNSGCNALSNFWRSLSNLEINVTSPGSAGCYYGNFWAVSQAAPLRRVHINGYSTLMDYCTGPSYASGGFIADSVTGSVTNGSQQQYFVRNSDIGPWSNAVWNQVFAGVLGAPAQSYPNPPYTTLASTPVSRERPFLTVDAKGEWSVFAPALRTGSVGTSWAEGVAEAGTAIPLSRFFVATPSTPEWEMNLALLLGKNLLLTPGVYALQQPIEVWRPDTVVLGLGFATLVPQRGRAAMEVAAKGVRVAGVIVDAGPVKSPVLLQVGLSRGFPFGGSGVASDPTTLNDVFFRVGGATVGSATTSLAINQDHVIVDDVWAWRADHGTTAGSTGWTVNPGDHGLVVDGDDVTALGLAVEHYEKEQVLWRGNGGETIFYQSELPYDVPSQAAWRDGGANGYPSYVVANGVRTHEAYGVGIYSFFNQGLPIVEDNAMTVPQASGVAVHDAGTVFLNGSGQITHVVDGVGGTAQQSNAGQLQPVVQYPQ